MSLSAFWRHVEVQPEGCWLWTGRRSPNGYGRARIAGVETVAHRASWAMLNGWPVESLDHLCRTRLCVNPTHLEQVPIKVNVLRGNGWAAINARLTACRRGHPFTSENTYINPAGRRECRPCRRMREARRRGCPLGQEVQA
jgi:hypothetical protein